MAEGPSALEHAKSPAYRDIYCNSAILRIATFDASLLLSQIKELDGKLVYEDQASIVMSLSHLKAMVLVLKNSLDAYEQALGEIKLPPGFSLRDDLQKVYEDGLRAVQTEMPKPEVETQPEKRIRIGGKRVLKLTKKK